MSEALSEELSEEVELNALNEPGPDELVAELESGVLPVDRVDDSNIVVDGCKNANGLYADESVELGVLRLLSLDKSAVEGLFNAVSLFKAIKLSAMKSFKLFSLLSAATSAVMAVRTTRTCGVSFMVGLKKGTGQKGNVTLVLV